MRSTTELAQLAELKVPMVRMRGQWIELDARRLAAGLKLVGRTGRTTVGELLRPRLGVDQVVDDVPVEGLAADGWLLRPCAPRAFSPPSTARGRDTG